MNDLAVATDLYAEVTKAGPGGRTSWRKTTTLLDMYGFGKLTPRARERIAASLAQAGLVADPPIQELTRTGTVRLRPRDALPSQPPTGTHTLRPPEVLSAGRAGDIAWFDVTADEVTADEFRAMLIDGCPGVDEDALDDAATPDAAPRVADVNDLVRLVSAVASFAIEDEAAPVEGGVAGGVVIQPVELLVGPGWLISVWQGAAQYRGARAIKSDLPVQGRREVVDAVKKSWRSKAGTSSGDVGLLLLEKLTVTHAATRRNLATWQEIWEQGFDKAPDPASFEQKTLERLNGLTSMLSQQLSAFSDPQGKDYKGGWFPTATDMDRARRLDDLTETALRDLDRRREAIRGAVQLVGSARAGASGRR